MRRTLSVLSVVGVLFTMGCDNDSSPFGRNAGDVVSLDGSAPLDGGAPLVTPPSTGSGGATATPSSNGGTSGASPVGAGGSGGGATAARSDAGFSGAASDGAVGAGGGLDAEVGEADAASNDAGPPTCATRSVWYADGDGDGHGSAATAVVGCSKPSATGWSTTSDDCDDADARVHPGQTVYFGVPYATASGDSYDFDCSGVEEPDPSAPLAPASCALVGVGDTCGGSGYLATKRTGAGKSPLCGSAQKSTCEAMTLVLCGPVTTAADAPFGCR
ncbi:MAG TPA: hypothetical protein VHU80_19325 [Polyangiaceae bacterium]|jgi:hypothetical protein|nr:hypothetical protein [Polyangiaceae bacterium]